MPTYEYRCPDGHDFEKFVQKISLASAELPCPVCGKIAARRISAGGGFVFKGSGFYITDYGKDGKKDLRANAAAATSADKDCRRQGRRARRLVRRFRFQKRERLLGEQRVRQDGSTRGDASKSDASKTRVARRDASKGESSKGERAEARPAGRRAVRSEESRARVSER